MNIFLANHQLYLKCLSRCHFLCKEGFIKLQFPTFSFDKCSTGSSLGIMLFTRKKTQWTEVFFLSQIWKRRFLKGVTRCGITQYHFQHPYLLTKKHLSLSVGPFMNISGGNVFLGKQLLSQACSLPPLNMYILEEATTAMENKKPTHLRNK